MKHTNREISNFFGTAFTVCLILAVCCAILAFVFGGSTPTFIALLATTGVLGFLSYMCEKQSYKYAMKALVDEGFASSVEEAILKKQEQKQKAQEKYEAEQRAQRIEGQKREASVYAAQHPQCPACHGYNTQRISTTKRVVSTSLVGLASSTIGKQYECLDCQHKW